MVVVAPALARAEEPPPSSDAAGALPGIHRVALAPSGPTRTAIAFSAGYGFTEAQRSGDSAHHRAIGILGLATAPAEWLEVGLRGDARYDKHAGDDVGFVLDPRLVARLGTPVSDDAHFGLELGAWLPGAEETQAMAEALSPHALLLLSWRSGKARFAVNVGYRLDRSAAVGDDADRLSSGDRMALGASDFDAMLGGAGVAYRTGRVDLLAELTADALVGAGAPGISDSPLRAAAGVRHVGNQGLQLEALVEASLSSRPGSDPGDALVPIEPRLALLLGVRYRFGEPSPPPALPPSTPPGSGSDGAPKPAPAQTAAADHGALTVVVRDPAGTDVEALVVLRTAEGVRALDHEAGGTYAGTDLPVGVAVLDVQVEGFRRVERQVRIEKQAPNAEPSRVEITLEPIPPAGQVRGLVRTFRGKAMRAKIRVEPIGTDVATDAEGYFQIDVPPGSYEVVIEAEGYRTQRRKVTVEKEGVVVINADLVKGK